MFMAIGYMRRVLLNSVFVTIVFCREVNNNNTTRKRMSEDPESRTPTTSTTVDEAASEAAADVVIDASRAAAAALAVTSAATNAAATANAATTSALPVDNTPLSEEQEEVPDVAIEAVQENFSTLKVDEVEDGVADSIGERRSQSGSPGPASNSGSLVPATGKGFYTQNSHLYDSYSSQKNIEHIEYIFRNFKLANLFLRM